jgi:hypothetical protein
VKRPDDSAKPDGPVKEAEPSLHQVVQDHPQVRAHEREFAQPDMVTKAHFDAHNGWTKITAKLKSDFPTVSAHGRHPKEKGLIIRATPAMARDVARSTQRRVTYLGSHVGGGDSRHEPGHYWQIHNLAIGTRIVGRRPETPKSSEHPRMADRRQDVFAQKIGAVVDAARRSKPPPLTALPGGRADEAIRYVFEARKLLPLHGTPAFKRRATYFPRQVVPSAANLEMDVRTLRSSDSGIGSTGSDHADLKRAAPSIIKNHYLGLHRAGLPHTPELLASVAAHAADYDSPERVKARSNIGTGSTTPKLDPVHPEVRRIAHGLHKKIVRKAVKAGIFTQYPHPDKPGVKVLSPGANWDNYGNDVVSQDAGVWGHDAMEHGTLGSDASQMGEYQTIHLRSLVGAVAHGHGFNTGDGYDKNHERMRRGEAPDADTLRTTHEYVHGDDNDSSKSDFVSHIDRVYRRAAEAQPAPGVLTVKGARGKLGKGQPV